MTNLSATELNQQVLALQADLDRQTELVKGLEASSVSVSCRLRKKPRNGELLAQYQSLSLDKDQAKVRLDEMSQQMLVLAADALAATQHELVTNTSSASGALGEFTASELSAARDYLDMSVGALYAEGSFSFGIWEPAPSQCLSCCAVLKLPRDALHRAVVLSKHCRSAKHLALLYGVERERLLRAAKALAPVEPCLLEIKVGKGVAMPAQALELTQGGAIVLPPAAMLTDGWRKRLARQARYWLRHYLSLLESHPHSKMTESRIEVVNQVVRWRETYQQLRAPVRASSTD